MNATRNLSISRDSEHVLSPKPPAKGSLGHVQMAVMARLSQTYLPRSWAVSEFNLSPSETRYHRPSGTEWIHKTIPQQFATGRCRTWNPPGGITPETERQLWLSFCDNSDSACVTAQIWSTPLVYPYLKCLIAMYHISCMDLKKTKTNPKITHTQKRFEMPGIYCTLHLGFFKCSFVCCLNALRFDCVRLCWLTIAKLIKFLEERLLRAPSCKGLWGQVLAKLMGSQQRSLCRTRGNNPSCLPPLYCTLWVRLAAVWWAGACCVWKYRMQLWVYSLFYS